MLLFTPPLLLKQERGAGCEGLAFFACGGVWIERFWPVVVCGFRNLAPKSKLWRALQPRQHWKVSTTPQWPTYLDDWPHRLDIWVAVKEFKAA